MFLLVYLCSIQLVVVLVLQVVMVMFDGPMIGYVHTEVRNSMFLFTLLYSYIVKVLLKPQTTVLRPRYRFWNSLTVFKQWFLHTSINEGWRTSHWRSGQKKSSSHVRKVWRISTLPHGVTSLWRPIATTSERKKRKKPITTTSVTGILTQCTVCSTYPNDRPF